MEQINRGPWKVTEDGVIKGPKKLPGCDYVVEGAPIGHINFLPLHDSAMPFAYWLEGAHSIWSQGQTAASYEIAAHLALELCVQMHGPAIGYSDDGCPVTAGIEAALACDPDLVDETNADWVASGGTVLTADLPAVA